MSDVSDKDMKRMRAAAKQSVGKASANYFEKTASYIVTIKPGAKALVHWLNMQQDNGRTRGDEVAFGWVRDVSINLLETYLIKDGKYQVQELALWLTWIARMVAFYDNVPQR